MKLTADYHTHTVYSDGKNTFLENFRRAKELGLAEIGCTEHGFSHVFRGLKRRELPQYIRELREAERETGMRAVRLDTYEGNAPARSLYAGLGFRLAGRADVLHEGVIPETRVLFEKEV